jgi:hypothetical protein
MLSLPFHRHLKWLALEGLSAKDIQSYYDNVQMAQPTDAQVAAITEEAGKMLMPPITRRRLTRKLHAPEDQAVWQRHGMEEIYLHQMGVKPWVEIGPLLNHPVMRVAIECCLVAKLTHEEISQLLPSVYTLPLSPESVAIYVKYFFDHTNMARSDWQAYLNQISDDRHTHTRLFAALTRPQEEVLHMVGLPSRLKFGTMLKNIMNTAYYRHEHYARQQTPEAQEEARKWAKVTIEAGAKAEKFGSSDTKDFASLIQTAFQYENEEVEMLTPEMLAEAKPPSNAALEKPVSPAAPLPPDTENQSGLRNDL